MHQTQNRLNLKQWGAKCNTRGSLNSDLKRLQTSDHVAPTGASRSFSVRVLLYTCHACGVINRIIKTATIRTLNRTQIPQVGQTFLSDHIENQRGQTKMSVPPVVKQILQRKTTGRSVWPHGSRRGSANKQECLSSRWLTKELTMVEAPRHLNFVSANFYCLIRFFKLFCPLRNSMSEFREGRPC